MDNSPRAINSSRHSERVPRSWLMGCLARSGMGPSLLSKIFGVSKLQIARLAEEIGKGDRVMWPSGTSKNVEDRRKLLCFLLSSRKLALHERKAAQDAHLLPRFLIMATVTSNLEHLTSGDFIKGGPVECEASYLPRFILLSNSRGTRLRIDLFAAQLPSFVLAPGKRGGGHGI